METPVVAPLKDTMLQTPSPAARKILAEKGMEVTQIKGLGKDGEQPRLVLQFQVWELLLRADRVVLPQKTFHA